MSFEFENMSHVGGSPPAPSIYSYVTTDTVAEVLSTGYFDKEFIRLRVNDVIQCKGIASTFDVIITVSQTNSVSVVRTSVTIDANGNLILTNDEGRGIIVGEDFGWRDIIGEVMPKEMGVNSPDFVTYKGAIKQFCFDAGDIIDVQYHIPHDYVSGSDIHHHIHWSHTGTAISGDAIFQQISIYAKGHNQENYSDEVSDTFTYATVNITATPQFRHRIDEVQLSTPGGSASMLDSNNLEPDGLILMQFKLLTRPTITAGELFVHTVDVHYQSTNIGTKNKVNDFYV